jgi:hypothetical protein
MIKTILIVVGIIITILGFIVVAKGVYGDMKWSAKQRKYERERDAFYNRKKGKL